MSPDSDAARITVEFLDGRGSLQLFGKITVIEKTPVQNPLADFWEEKNKNEASILPRINYRVVIEGVERIHYEHGNPKSNNKPKTRLIVLQD